MPSGAKKRKAAKKKKDLVAHINPSSNTSQGNKDIKNQDDKEIQESSSSNTGVLNERKNGTDQNESVKGSPDDDRSSSSSSSSDDESVDTTKKPDVLDGKTNDLVVPTAASIVNSVTPEVSASEETINIVESASVENTAIPDMIASKKLETTPFRATDGVTYVPVTAPRDLSSKPNEDRDLHLSAQITESPENFRPESEDQPLIGSRPPVPQRTSWFSCCGLCDVFTGSNR